MVSPSNPILGMGMALSVVLLLVPGVSHSSEKGEVSSAQSNQTRLRVCTAQRGNNYFRAGQKLKALLDGKLDVTLIETKGSWENLAAIDRERRACDAIIAQDDAYALHEFERPDSFLTMKRMGTLFPEHVHLICPRTLKVNSLQEAVTSKVDIIVNQYGSGSYITWKLFSRLNRLYRKANVIEMKPEEALLRIIEKRKAACMFYVSRIGGRVLDMADRKMGDRLQLIPVTDARLHRPVGREKVKVYADSVIPAGGYLRMQSKAVRTQSVGAVFFVSPDWLARYPSAQRVLTEAVIDLLASKK